MFDLTCANCGGQASAETAFCPHCGVRRGSEPTVERRLFGLAPPLLSFVLAVVALCIGVALLTTGHWLFGALLLVLAAAFAIVSLSAARQARTGRFASTAVRVGDEARWRGEFFRVWLASLSGASREAVRVRVRQRRLRRERRSILRELGDAVYAADAARAEALKAEAHERDRQIDESEQQLRAALVAAHERVGRERMAGAPTQVLPDGAEMDAAAGRSSGA